MEYATVRGKAISKRRYTQMKKMGYIEKGRDGIERGLFLTERGTSSIPIIKIKPKDKKTKRG